MSDFEEKRRSILATLQAQADGTPQKEQRDQAAIEARRNAAALRSQRLRSSQTASMRPSGDDQILDEPVQRPALHAPSIPSPSARQLPDERRVEYATLPQRKKKKSYGTLISFLLFVGLPTILAAFYYFAYASNQYVVEFHFAVRQTSQGSSSIGAQSGLAMQLGIATSSNPTENYMVTDYLMSRQIVDELQQKIKLTSLFTKPDLDWWARFDPQKPIERFVLYWRTMVTASFDQITGIAVARVRAFTPEDAFLIANTMVALSENLVNEIGLRPRRDAVVFAEQEVKRAEDRLKGTREALSVYRDKEGVIDPKTNVVASNTTLAQTLRASLLQYQSELALLTRQKVNATAPPVQILQSRINTTREQLVSVESQIGTAQDRTRPLSGVVGEFEKLEMDRQFAETSLTSTLQSLEQARATALVQHLYVTPFVRPSMPQSSTYPSRVYSTLMVGFVCFLFWTIALLVIRSIRDHLS